VAGVMDRVLTTTEFGRRQLLVYGVAAAKILVIPNGTDFHRQEPATSRASVRASLGVPSGARMVGMVANMAPVKRHALFIDMLSRMPGVYGVIAGGVLPLWDGEAYERQLRARVDALGLRDRVLFAGMRDDVPDVMRAMDVLVCPSQHESFGRVLIEAMAVGTPVVATTAGAIPDVVENGRTGILAADDAQELANAVARLLDDPREVERLTTAAREEVERRFDVRDVTRRIEDVYRELLNE
jgi:glycosyltransferase involved in cell wall biosynthesis